MAQVAYPVHMATAVVVTNLRTEKKGKGGQDKEEVQTNQTLLRVFDSNVVHAISMSGNRFGHPTRDHLFPTSIVHELNHQCLPPVRLRCPRTPQPDLARVLGVNIRVEILYKTAEPQHQTRVRFPVLLAPRRLCLEFAAGVSANF